MEMHFLVPLVLALIVSFMGTISFILTREQFGSGKEAVRSPVPHYD